MDGGLFFTKLGYCCSLLSNKPRVGVGGVGAGETVYLFYARPSALFCFYLTVTQALWTGLNYIGLSALVSFS